ncbi:hypothetical protein AI2942V1_1482 [Klebsiella pneumoniae]|nr:hypothetical protein AI2675V1_3103 [Klebsiella pneumoniae]CAH3858849.1 hypothetical protein AI2675V1_3103 [Klebsiella pneumoniae]CAH5586126.1 hypothetical protein AI2942V1_1482 [Klebsiella pneumoniae]HBY2141806.1 hypothetical protein [Klebsiella pneumoniae]
MSDIDYISYIIFGLIVWALLIFMDKHDRIRHKFEFSVKWLFAFLWPLTIFLASFVYYLQNSTTVAGILFIVGCVLCIPAYVVASENPHQAWKKITSFFK